jgi:hypothetical protein
VNSRASGLFVRPIDPSDPETQAKLTEIAKIAHLGLTIRAAEARHIAIAALEVCAKEADDLVEKRRAAFALYRATASPLIPPPGSARGSSSTGSSATGCLSTSAPAPPPLPPAPKPLDHPRPDLNPDNITRIVSQALLINRHNTPEVGSGFATLNAFLTPDVTICGTQLPDSSDPDPSNSTSSCATGCLSTSAPDSSSPSSSSSPSAPLPLSPSAPSSSSLAARRIAAIRETPLGELDGHCWCMAHDLDEPGDALTKIHTWFVPREGGVRHFTFTLETKLFHFPEAQPDCWYITSIDHCDPIALRRAPRAAAERAARTREAPEATPPQPPHTPCRRQTSLTSRAPSTRPNPATSTRRVAPAARTVRTGVGRGPVHSPYAAPMLRRNGRHGRRTWASEV